MKPTASPRRISKLTSLSAHDEEGNAQSFCHPLHPGQAFQKTRIHLSPGIGRPHITTEKTFERELQGLKSAMDELSLPTSTIVTWDDETAA
jgi:hypothetical protein